MTNRPPWLKRKLKKLNRLFAGRDRQAARVAKWYQEGGNDRLFCGHDLDEHSLCVDVGGYLGDWTAEIFARYAPTVHICEPVRAFVQRLEERFARNSRISIHPVGLGGRDEAQRIYLNDDSTSTHRTSGAQAAVQFVRGSTFLRPFLDQGIDLLAINAEGAEYDLLDDLLDDGALSAIGALQVQFHDVVADSDHRMKTLHERLRQTHELVFQYEYVWESWRRRVASQRLPGRLNMAG